MLKLNILEVEWALNAMQLASNRPFFVFTYKMLPNSCMAFLNGHKKNKG